MPWLTHLDDRGRFVILDRALRIQSYRQLLLDLLEREWRRKWEA